MTPNRLTLIKNKRIEDEKLKNKDNIINEQYHDVNKNKNNDILENEKQKKQIKKKDNIINQDIQIKIILSIKIYK